MANSVRIHAGVRDDASGPIDKIRDRFAKLKEQGAAPILSGVAAGATVAAFGAIQGAIGGVTGAFGDAVRGAIDEEASLKRLALAIGENDKAWDGNIAKVNEVIEARQSLGFADDEQRDGLAVLVSVTGDHTKALELQRTAMDLARLRGMDLRTASDLLGKVYSGNIGILGRYGIKLKEGATAQEALAEIQRRSAGQAEAYGETTAGAMEAAGIAVDNLKEDFGKLLLPIIKEGAEFLTKTAIPAVKDFAEGIGDIAQAAQDAAKPVADFFDDIERRAGMELKLDGLFGSVDQLNESYDVLIKGKTSIDGLADAALAAYPSIGILFDALREGLDIDPVPLEDSFGSMFAAIEEQGRSIGGEWGAMGRELPNVFAKGILDARQAPLDAMTELKALLKASMSETAETSRLLGQLASEELAKGLIDKDPAVRNAAAGARNTIINRLADLEVTPGTLSRKGMDALIDAMKSKDPIIADAARTIYNSVKGALPSAADMFKWSKAGLKAYADAFYAMEPELEQAALYSLHGVKGVFEAHSPPGPKSPLHEIDKWGKATGLAWVEGFIESLGSAAELTKLKLAGVKAEFADFLRGYGGIGGLLPSAGPEMSEERLREYIANLTKSLEGESDPQARLAILQKIAEYTERLERVKGQENTGTQDDIETLMGYLDNLDKALLTEKDPDKRAALIAKWVLYYLRMEELRSAPASTRALAPGGGGETMPVALLGSGGGTGGGTGGGPLQVNINVSGPLAADPFSVAVQAFVNQVGPAFLQWLRLQGISTGVGGDGHQHAAVA